MRRAVTILGAAAAVVGLPSGPAAARQTGGELYAVFADVCLAHDNDDEAAEAKAVSLGFQAAQAMKPMEGERFFLRGQGPDRLVLRVGDVASPGFGGLSDAWMRTCSVAQAGPNEAAAKAAIAWASVPVTDQKGGVRLYIYLQKKSGRTPVTGKEPPASLQAAMRAGELRSLTVKATSAETNLMLASGRAPR